MNASAPPGARASKSVMPSPTITTVLKLCFCWTDGGSRVACLSAAWLGKQQCSNERGTPCEARGAAAHHPPAASPPCTSCCACRQADLHLPPDYLPTLPTRIHSSPHLLDVLHRLSLAAGSGRELVGIKAVVGAVMLQAPLGLEQSVMHQGTCRVAQRRPADRQLCLRHASTDCGCNAAACMLVCARSVKLTHIEEDGVGKHVVNRNVQHLWTGRAETGESARTPAPCLRQPEPHAG